MYASRLIENTAIKKTPSPSLCFDKERLQIGSQRCALMIDIEKNVKDDIVPIFPLVYP